ncbi:hypothetical protein [Boseongicola aestuarii]
MQITEPDSAKSAQNICCRDLSKMKTGQCKRVLLTDQVGGIIKEPIML